MSTVKDEQPSETNPKTVPAWIREPEAPQSDGKQAKAESDVSQPLEEPGYGHGV